MSIIYRLRKKSFSMILLLITLFCITSNLTAQNWQALGPGPILDGQVEGITDAPTVGAIHGIAPHPKDPNILYVASVNGGVWKTSNATAGSPTWLPLTDDQPSLSFSDIEFDLADPSFQTLVASFGRFSSLGGVGGSRAGVIRTTDGGASWTQIGTDMIGRNISSIEVNGNRLLATVNFAEINTCNEIGVFRSIDLGVSWAQISTAQGIPAGAATALVADPLNANIYYAGIHTYGGSCSALANGIYKSIDAGLTWSKVNDLAMESIIGNESCNFKIAVGQNVGTNNGETSNVFVAMVCYNGTLDAVFRSGNGGVTWTMMNTPGTYEEGVFYGIHSGGQGFLHISLAADPSNDNIVYIGGDRQPFGLPNSINAAGYSGRLFRGDASLALGSQWQPLTHIGTANNSSPHADSRDLRFAANGTLLEADDGGIYRQIAPRTLTGDWISVNGNLQINEQHDTAYDTRSSIVISGTQDTGNVRQNQFVSTTWEAVTGGDGGDVAIDTSALGLSMQSIRYYSVTTLSLFTKAYYDENNVFVFGSLISPIVLNGGAAIVGQFYTPLVVNQATGHRLVIGGLNSIYESLDQGTTVSEIGVGITVTGGGRNAIAYGAFGNEDIIYVGACQGACNTNTDGADGVFVRNAINAPFVHTFTPASGAIQGIAANVLDSTEAFLIEDNRVLHSTDTGITWINITGNLTDFGQLLSIAYMLDGGNPRLVVGSNKGVFQSRQSEGFSHWTVPAAGLPNAPIYELQYDLSGDRLIAGTLGRGAFVLAGALRDNSPPVVGNDIIEMAKGGVATTVLGGASSLIDNDTDANAGDMLTVDIIPVTQPTNGLVTLFPDGTFIYQHDDSYTNTDQFFYRVCDDGFEVMCTIGQVDISIDIGGAVCSSANVPIPNDNGIGVSDTLTVPTSGEITDLNVFVEINHSFVGDIAIYLQHLSTGTFVILLDRPGVPALGSLGCSENDISAIFDDQALSDAEDQCATPIALTGNLLPSLPLSAFNTEELAGNWTLTAVDVFTGSSADTGALISWCLQPTVVSNFPVLDSIGNKNINELEALEFTVTATDDNTAANDLVYSLFDEPTGANITPDGNFSFTPTEAQGPGMYTFDVIVVDSSMPALSNTETITVTVAEVYQFPILNPIGNQTTMELTPLNFIATASDTDLPAETLTFSLSGQPTGASITLDGLFSFTPTQAQGPGMYTFDVIVSDETLIDIETITVQVLEIPIFENGFELIVN